jgi:UDP-3-O-[3-hydroxymyristoyl] glucosamine N-acyltransferase
MAYTVDVLARLVDARIEGDASYVVSGLADLRSAGPEDIAFLSNPKYLEACRTTRAGVLLLTASHAEMLQGQGPAVKLVVQNPYWAMARISQLLHPKHVFPASVHPQSSVHPTAHVPASCHIGAFAVVEEGARLGEHCCIESTAFVGRNAVLQDGVHLHPGAKILHGCHAGRDVVLQAGAVVGSDGFGYALSNDGSRVKIPQVGTVVLEDGVEIGANTTVDRATLGVTRIGKGTKIDNLVQIAHNVAVGEHCVIVSQTGIAGSTTLGNNVVVGAQGGIVGHIHIANNVMLGARAGVPSSIESPGVYSGSPAIPHKKWLKMSVALPEVPEMRRQLRALQKNTVASSDTPQDT